MSNRLALGSPTERSRSYQLGELMRKTAAALLFLILVVSTFTGSASAQDSGDHHWVSAWTTSVMAPMRFPGMPPEAPLENQTIRMIVRPTIGAQRIRVRLSNEFGKSPLEIGAAHVALTDSGAKIKPGTDRVLTFGGREKISIPAGAPILSDPVELPFKAFSKISISIYLPSSTAELTVHSQGQHNASYFAGPGDLTSKDDLPYASAKSSWYFLSGIEALAPSSVKAIVAFGDSITEGASRKPDENYTDYPNQLAERLSAERNAGPLAVVNEGIGGNRVLHDAAGVSALARFDRDVLAQPGVSTIILFEGINDIGFPRVRMSELPKNIPHPKENPFATEKVSAEEIIVGLTQIVARAHDHGIRVFGATLTPFEGTNSYDAEGEALRQAVNKWIRSTDVYDGVFDFDAVLRDPVHPSRLRGEYDSGDHIHPNTAGYKAMADSIPLALLRIYSSDIKH